jgi:hypothetical protein
MTNESKDDRFIPTTEFHGGSLRGYVTLSYADLVKVFGEPNSEGDEYKVSTSWTLVDQETGDGVEVYDYKETSLYSSSYPSVESFRALPEYDWHLGGGTIDFRALSSFLSKKLGRTITCRKG